MAIDPPDPELSNWGHIRHIRKDAVLMPFAYGYVVVPVTYTSDGRAIGKHEGIIKIEQHPDEWDRCGYFELKKGWFIDTWVHVPNITRPQKQPDSSISQGHKQIDSLTVES